MTSSDSTHFTLVEGIERGERLALARAITLVENESPHAAAIVAALHARTGKAHIVGVTGAPGSGKSTLVTALAREDRQGGRTVAIIAIDPTSPFTGGALLGDRVRMRALAGDTGVFVRSMATRGSLGGLSKTTGEVALLLDAAGFERIYIETVGAGQAEVEIASTAHTTVVVEAPGMGDEIQSIKAGILEIADLLVVNKADRSEAERTVRALEMMLELEGSGPRFVRHHGALLKVESPQSSTAPATDHRPPTADNWRTRVYKTIASDGTGVADLLAQIEAHREWLQRSGEWHVRERLRAAHMVEGIVRAALMRRIAEGIDIERVQSLVDEVCGKQVDPYAAAAFIVRDS